MNNNSAVSSVPSGSVLLKTVPEYSKSLIKKVSSFSDSSSFEPIPRRVRSTISSAEKSLIISGSSSRTEILNVSAPSPPVKTS